MRKDQEILFSLLKSALWGVPSGDIPDDVDWTEVLSHARKQTVTGLVADAIQMIPEDKRPASDVMNHLRTSRVVSIRTHSMLDTRLAEVLSILRKEGVEPVLFKGQGLALNYPDPTARQCGDIDLYVGGPDYEKSCAAALKAFGAHEHDAESIKHYHLKYKEVDVELHRIAESLPGYFIDRRYQEWTLKHLHGQSLRKVDIGGVEVQLPPYQFDCVYVLNHLWHHFVNGGIGLRQVCDWTMYLHRFHDRIDSDVLRHDLKRFRLNKVWNVFASIAVHHLGLPAEECPLYDGRKDKSAAAVLDYIFSEGNFGHHSEKKTPRPKGYTAGKLHSFRNLTARYAGLMRIFPMHAIRYYIHFISYGIYHYIKGLI